MTSWLNFPFGDHPSQDESLHSQAWRCWQNARGENVLPSKKDYEATILEYPDLVPNLVVVEWNGQGSLRHIMIGSKIVQRRAQDHTSMIVAGLMVPMAEAAMYVWVRSCSELRHGTYFETYTHLPSGAVGTAINLGLPLFSTPDCVDVLCMVTQADEASQTEVEKGRFEIASAGLSFHPIDLGFGVGDIHPSLSNIAI